MRVSTRASVGGRLAALLAASLVAGALLAPPVLAGVSPDDPDFKDLAGFLGELGFQPDAVARIAAAASQDKLQDLHRQDDLAAAPPFQDDGIDIRIATFFELEGSAADIARWFAPGGPLAAGTPGVVAPANPLGGSRGNEFYVYATTVAGTSFDGDGTGRIEAGLAAFTTTPVGGGPSGRYQKNPSFPGDFFDQANVAWSTRSDAAAPFQLLSFAFRNGGWLPADTDAISVIRGRTLVTLVPDAEASGFVDARAFSFAGLPAGNVSDAFPDMGLPLLPVASLPKIATGASVPSSGPATTVPGATGGGSTQAPVATSAPAASGGPTASGGSAPPASSATFGIPNVAWVVGGVLIALLGFWLLFGNRRRKPAPVAIAGGGGAVVARLDPSDPCPPLIAAAKAARAACEEARRAADAAEAVARARAAEADEAKRAADRATHAREDAEKELERRRRPPDRGAELGSTDFGGRHVSVDAYDLKLQADARAAANAAHAAAVGKATTEAERNQAHQDWQDELKRIDGPDGLDEVRRRDQTGREQWIQDGEAAVQAARAAEDAANATAAQAAQAARAAQDAATAARHRADDLCAEADRAEQAAADCLPPTPQPPGPPAPPTPPQPPQPPPTPTPPGGQDGGGTPPGPGGTSTKPTQPPRPHGQQCPDGTEAWRAEPPSQTFLVPVPGEKVRMTVVPGLDAFTEYYDAWKPFDADGKLTGDSVEGIPGSAFARADDNRWTQLFGKIGNKAKHNEITIALPLQEVTAHCERLWRCVDGYWERTTTTRAVEGDAVPVPKQFRIEGEVITTNEVVVLGRTAVAAWRAAEAARRDLATFETRCR